MSERAITQGGGRGFSRRGLLVGAGTAAVAAAIPATPASAKAAPVVIRAPVTLSTLKELSERAMQILRAHFPQNAEDGAFLAEAGENYHGRRITCDSPEHSDLYCSHCVHPLEGTPMLGGMSGYYEPEWSEETAYCRLQSVLKWCERPDTMTEAEWSEALAIVGMTPSEHAKQMAWIEGKIAALDTDTFPPEVADLATAGGEA